MYPLRHILWTLRISTLCALLVLQLFDTAAAEVLIPQSVKQVDQMIEATLKAQKIKPSKEADDAEFLRRVYLDLAGQPPSPETVLEFLRSGRKHKRAQIIEDLIGSEAYLDHWTIYWSNLLITRTPSGIVNRTTFEQWLRDALSQNLSYRDFVTQLLTAEGTNTENGATNFYLNYGLSPVDLTSKTARTFLSIPIQCAQCHNHLTEKWTQEDFYSFASFFTDMKQEPVKDPQDENRTIGYQILPAEPRSLAIPDRGQQVSPRFIDGTTLNSSSDSGREALAQLVTAPSNTYFSRGIVNRMWSYFLGRGFVEPVDGFGIEHPPSHPELLDWLAEDFRKHGYDLRYLMRTILNTETYQRSSATNDTNQNDQTYFSHALLRPLAPEQLFNSLLQATGFERLYKRRHRDQLEQLRRSYRDRFVYVFGNNDGDSQIESFSGTIPQALMMINGALVTEGSQYVKGNNLDLVLQRYRTVEQRVAQIYLLCLARKPRRSEISYFQGYMRGYTNPQLAYEDIFWSLLNSSEFIYNH